MRIKEKTRTSFWGTHKGCDIQIERDYDIPDRKFYIQVRGTDGGYLYDGYSPEGVTTMKQAKAEALKGAKL